MTRCILVLGTGRSGTSAVAGALHKLGVHMGDAFVDADRANPHGTYEDREVFDATRRVLAGQAGPEVYAPLVRARAARHALWGLKDPALCHVAQHILPLLDEARVVVAKRGRADTINSYMRAYRAGRAHAERWYEAVITATAARLLEFGGPVLEVAWEELLDDPEEGVRRLMHFAFEGLELPGPRRFLNAVKHIQRKPKRELQGWGHLAVGVRVAKHPEPAFFADWTKLLTGGLRTGDTVLMPQMHQPAHWAATKLARGFLRGDKDSLLMVDDDMTFPMAAAHRLREHRANWEYDVVMAFATHRTWPPKPVTLKLMDEPPAPQSLRGGCFGYDLDVEVGQVVEVDALGLAFTLIRRRVLEAMVDDEWGVDETYFFRYGQGWESDDIPFCHKCRELGFRMAIDAGVPVGHIGAQPLSWEEFVKWRAGLSAEGRARLDYACREPEEQRVDVDADEVRVILEAAADLGGDVGARARALLGRIDEADTDTD